MQTVLIVDDTPENLLLLSALLQPHYRVRAATSGARALRVAASPPRPDLILLDVMMPEMDGYTVLERLKAETCTAGIPVIFVTALDRGSDEERGLAMGAVDYISKPIKPAVVLARVKTHLELKLARDWLQDRNAVLQAEIARRMEENLLVQDISIRALAHLAEIRDPETGNHLRRTQGYIRVLADQLTGHPRFSEFLTEQNLHILIKSAPLHDIGKVGIPDHILLKPGKLTPREWEIMKTHCVLGCEAIEQAERDAEKPVEFLRMAKEIAHYHHEKWDGSGYPEGLAGDAIPISARLMALADVFDALIARRAYKPPLPFERSVAIIREGRGAHFDPDIVDAFLARLDAFESIAAQHADTEAESLAKMASLLGEAAVGP
ncbi:MAG: two-component system response regulator [Candidatus Competibacter sp.]|nr:two-component system response regulator [Candidatus Competibacter sp.]